MFRRWRASVKTAARIGSLMTTMGDAILNAMYRLKSWVGHLDEDEG